MKKVLLGIALFFTFILIYLLQTNLFSWFTIAGIKPNLMVILVLFIGLFAGRIYGGTFGVIFGLLIDIFISKKVGVSSIMYGAIGIFGGFLDRNFSKDSKITIFGMVMVYTLLFELFSYIINAIIFSYTWEFLTFTIKLTIEIFYNAIITVILYPLIQKAGYGIQDMFKENKILTRYY